MSDTKFRIRRKYSAGLSAGVVVSAVFLLVLTIASFFPQFFTSGDPLATDPLNALLPPSPEHLFGTDQSGRDVYTRAVYGASQSMTIAWVATLISITLGVAIGAIAGFGGRVVDLITSRFIEVMFSFPSLLLALLVITIFGASIPVTTVAIGIATTPSIARLVRAEVLRVTSAGYVEAATVLGKSRIRILLITVIPNAVRPLIAFAFLNVGIALIWATTLGYLGFTASPPTPEWGSMLAEAQAFISVAWWMPVCVGLLVIATAMAATVLGAHLQKVLTGRGAIS